MTTHLVLVSSILALIALSPVQALQTPTSLDVVSIEPTAPFLPNIRVTDGSSPYRWQVEPTMVVNRSGTIFVGWKEAFSADGPGRRVGFSYSEDGGSTWAPNVLMPQGHSSNLQCANSDPWMALAPDDRVHYAYLEYECSNGDSGIDFTSTADGRTWSDVVYLDGAGGLSDKESIAVDPSGRIYAAWDEAYPENQLHVTWSDDGGTTWAPFVYPTTSPILGVIVAASPDGTVYLTWWDLNSDNIMFDWSSTGGLTWHPDIRINSEPGSAQASGPWQIPIPAMNVDIRSGTIYVAWPDSRDSLEQGQDIYVASSTDGGQTWSENVRVNDDSGRRTQYMVDLAVDAEGTVHAAWEDLRNGNWNIYDANSTDGGATWTPNVRISTEDTPGTYDRPGDYIAIEAGPDDTIHVVWTDGRGDDFDIFYARNPGSPTVTVTVRTEPAGLPISVDGETVAGPATYTWITGSIHTLSVEPIIPANDTSRFVWTSWSDGGAATHEVIAGDDAILTATFQKQHAARFAPYPDGLEILVDGVSYTTGTSFWWDEGSVHSLDAPSPQLATPEVRYVWVEWSDGGDRSHTVVSTAAMDLRATFLEEQSLGIETNPAGLVFSLDGIAYIAPATFWLEPGSSHQVSVSGLEVAGPGIQYRFASWSDGGAIEHAFRFSAPVILRAQFSTEYRLTVESAVPGSEGNGFYPAGSTAVAAVTYETYAIAPGERLAFRGWSRDATGTGLVSDPIVMDSPKTAIAMYGGQFYVEVVSSHGDATGEGWYDSGSEARAIVGSDVIVIGVGARVLFMGWSGDAIGSATTSDAIGIDGPKTAVALWTEQFLLTIQTEYGGALGGGWYDSGSSATAEAENGIVLLADGIRVVFAGWSGDATGADPEGSDPVLMDRARNALALWSFQYELRIETPFAQAIGAGWYASGSTAIASLDAAIEVTGKGTREVFAGWTGDGTGRAGAASDPIRMDGPKVARATWQAEFLLQVLSDRAAIDGGGWYPAGSQVTLVAPAEVVSDGQRYAFAGWSGDISSSDRTLVVELSGPMSVRATWASLTTSGDSNVSIAMLTVFLIGVAVAITALVRRRSRDD